MIPIKIKQNFFLLTLKTVILFFSFTYNSTAQSVGINATGAPPHNSAILDLNADDKGFLITRSDTGNIISPAFGLMTLAPADSCLYMHNGETSGKKWISIGGVGSDCPCSCSTPLSFPCNGTVIPVINVTNPITGKTWMDRNLGASQVATSSTDAAAYGDLYQWGRCSDGHEKRNSGTTSTLSPTDDPGHGNFILASFLSATGDWRNPQNDNLWQGVNGINNPCPTGYRIPTLVEIVNEHLNWSSQNSAGAFNSPLKLTVAGYRVGANGSLTNEGTTGFYWTSTVNGMESRSLSIHNNNVSVSSSYRGPGFSIRCIKD